MTFVILRSASGCDVRERLRDIGLFDAAHLDAAGWKDAERILSVIQEIRLLVIEND